jgi:hypothetical protein
MKMFALSLVTFGLGFSSLALANGVEKTVIREDAANVHLVKAQIEQVPVGTRPADAPNGNLEGIPDEGVFAPALVAYFEYTSASYTPDAGSGSGPDGQIYSWDDTNPQVRVVLDVPASELNAIKAGKIKAASLIHFSVAVEKTQVEEQSGDSCEFNYETGMNVDPNCVEPTVTTVQNLKTLTVRAN